MALSAVIQLDSKYTKYTERLWDREKSPENDNEFDRLGEVSCNYKVAGLSDMLADRVSFVLFTPTSAELFLTESIWILSRRPVCLRRGRSPLPAVVLSLMTVTFSLKCENARPPKRVCVFVSVFLAACMFSRAS